ncbi:MAG TPA: hypothetical protein VIG76_08350, partial [Amnibacterium sp.]|uniref:hypothetical protein n=1 Tax=Amnibacterium sp. TaxID=1872496 RepID=UPI002F955C88
SSATWMRPVVGQSVPVATPDDAAAGILCLECRSSGEMTLNLDQLNDSSRNGHNGFLDDLADGTALSRMRLYRNGVKIDDDPFLGVDAKVPAGAANYTAIAETNAGAAGFILGTHLRSVYTFRSSATSGAAVPGAVICPVDDGNGCTTLPLLRIVAPLPTSGTGTTRVGAMPFSFTIMPIPGARATTVKAEVEVSFDHGKHFTAVPVTAKGHNAFTAKLVNPARSAGTTATLRFTGRDTAGNTITETVAAAYRVASK